ncbi:TetR family transcriptional regulator [Mycobacterium sp. 852013-51886_SCH5428379]|uniref:TetR family transcriptional regulator n=1 Tax=Mycobacterium sp. 852013-51886_SCH5428379 TaxID=1834111 RepID=UPI0007FE6D2D|nr:TetR family transcriptional regulator [Mycobacterium sp. 852013-51886_SCH5428379]OBB59429.1 TetR family transcriptional regulator [Mycobacterium sp. 852013-51886_SCH5428379]
MTDGHDPILAVVVEILETDGYDAVQLREVARRARTSLATIYKRHATRDDLIVAALQKWMDDNRYSGLAEAEPVAGESLYTGMMRMLRALFEPWERNPGMLTAFFRARSSPNGQLLFRRGLDIVAPTGLAVLGDVDEAFIRDLDTVLSNVVFGLLGRFAIGEIAVTDIVPALDRTVYWLTTGYETRHCETLP